MSSSVRAGGAILLVAALAAVALGGVAAQPATDSVAAMKAAVRAHAGSSPPIEKAELVRVVGDYAAIRIYPPFGTTDPAIVILRRAAGSWRVIAGPGTGFAPPLPGGAPDDLFDYDRLYTGDTAQSSIDLLPTGRRWLTAAGFRLQYPADATVTERVMDSGPTWSIDGPVSTGIFAGPSFTISVRLAGQVSGPLDDWAYARLQEEVARRRAEGGPVATYQPRSVSFFHTAVNDVFQVDWFGGDSTIREFYVAPTGGGRVAHMTTRVYPIENNPAAPLAQIAVTLVLQTIQLDHGLPGAGG
jgi:hypothetical protein